LDECCPAIRSHFIVSCLNEVVKVRSNFSLAETRWGNESSGGVSSESAINLNATLVHESTTNEEKNLPHTQTARMRQ
jgi:hypothetical protein